MLSATYIIKHHESPNLLIFELDYYIKHLDKKSLEYIQYLINRILPLIKTFDAQRFYGAFYDTEDLDSFKGFESKTLLISNSFTKLEEFFNQLSEKIKSNSIS